jgi:hypothetical protein
MMKRKVSILIVVSVVQIVIAVSLLMLPASVQAVNAWAWCNGSCGGCGVMEVMSGGCSATGCISCGCWGCIDYDCASYREACPGGPYVE